MSKWVLVTGSAHRIGRVIALNLAANGWNIVLHHHHSSEEAAQTAKDIEKKGRKVHLVQSNFADKRRTEDLIPELVEEIGPLAALVNNASLFEPDSTVPGGYDHKMINLEAPLVLAEAFRKQALRGKNGAIVNILDGCIPAVGFMAYNDSKKSLRVMTIELARRMAPDVRVNGVAPGPVMATARQTPDHFKRLIDATLLKSEIAPEAIAGAVRFLVENPSITGEILHIDGGIRLKNTPSMTHAKAS